MAEPLKYMYNEGFARDFAGRVREALPTFDEEAFVRLTFAPGWDELELKGRMRRVTESLAACLPADYGQALDVLESITEGLNGFAYMIFPDFVERYGLGDWDRSIRALAHFTRISSSEFAVRPFIRLDQERMMAQMLEWSGHDNEHVRRLASEGCRPRLPWADALPALKRDPSPILPILERLKADPSEYVRRSVANNLNDISKDHPELVVDIARRWYGHDPLTDRVVRHACRGLLKAAHPAVLALLGLDEELEVTVERWTAAPSAVPLGGTAEVHYAVRLPAGVTSAKLRLELAVTFPRPNGRGYRKLFKLSEREAAGGALVQGMRRHSFEDLSTRKHYPGLHTLALIANGREAASVQVELTESPV